MKTFPCFFIVISFLFNHDGATSQSVKNKCKLNRHIFLAKQGTITDGADKYADSQMCEWLIKGDPGEKVTVKIQSAHIECLFDYLYVHDGSSATAPLLAVITGLHTSITIAATGHMMYIALHSDGHLSYGGFELTYSIDKCPQDCSNNSTYSHGECKDGKCLCKGDRYGDACQFQWCKDNLCNQAIGNGVCKVTEKECACKSGIYGESCSIENKANTGLNRWYQVTEYSTVFRRRAGHTSEYVASVNKLFVFGGYSLSEVYGDLIFFDFSRNKWEIVKPIGSHKPEPVYSHASTLHKDGLVVFGGEFSNKSLSNELWFYNITTNSWLLLSNDALIPGIVGHVLVNANAKLYVIGGQVSTNLSLSTDVYMFDMELRIWEKQRLNYGKSSQLLLFGHSAVYYPPTESIIVYGGYRGRTILKMVELTTNMYVYNTKNKIWSLLSYENGFKPPATAFHGSAIVGNYFIVYGGYSSQCLLQDKLYLYNLDSNQWLTINTLVPQSTSGSTDPKHLVKPIYSHSMAVKDFQTLIVSGGFDNAQSSGHVIAYKLPGEVVKISETTGGVVLGSYCGSYKDKDQCVKDPNCYYCGTLTQCFSTFNSSANPLCPSTPSKQCTALTSCEACAAQYGCSWCSMKSSCSLTANTNTECRSTVTGWWGSKNGVVIGSPEQCGSQDRPAGITDIWYVPPMNAAYPDHVKVRSNTRWDSPSSEISTVHDGRKINFVWRGKMHPFLHDDVNAKIKLFVKTSSVNVVLLISVRNGSSEMGKVVELPMQREEFSKEVTEREGTNNVKIFPVDNLSNSQKNQIWYRIQMDGLVSVEANSRFKLVMYWVIESLNNEFTIIDYQFLEPYSTNNCSQYITCMGCVSDASCGWCATATTVGGGSCVDRTSPCKNPQGDIAYLQHKQDQCHVCSDHFTCQSCDKDNFCMWEDAVCKRQELAKPGSRNNCMASCTTFNYDTCVLSYGCFWCTERKKCLSFVDYHTQNHYSECYTFRTTYTLQEVNCTKYSNCSQCMDVSTCGWCYNHFDSRKGRCVSGDFSGPSSNCSALGNYSEWKYDRCPDVNECSLNLYTCRANSTCLNTDGSYRCQCNPGFEGDGKIQCTKTCWPSCGDHGSCNKTDYTCKCHLGWKGKNCSIDCGCNGHSTCVSAVGVCDQCQNNTIGEFCQNCVNGSYGNATSNFGCRKCECNGNGDELRNLCDIVTGDCFCVNNTQGRNCEKCLDGFELDTRLKRCVLACNRSNNHVMASRGFISAWDDVITAQCLWTLAVDNITYNDQIYYTGSGNHNLLLKIHLVKTSCFDSAIQIYDGVPPNPRTGHESRFELLATICGDSEKETVPVSFYRSKTGILTIVYNGNIIGKENTVTEKILKYNEQGFYAEYIALKCPHSCPQPFECSNDSICRCPEGKTGHYCERYECPNNCTASLNQGSCDQATGVCKCEPGFTGLNCNINTTLKDGFRLEKISSYLRSSLYRYVEYGSTMVYYQGKLYVFGNVKLNKGVVFLKYDITTGVWTDTSSNIKSQPFNRYLHCAFVYRDAMFIYGGIANMVFDDFWSYNFTTNVWSQIILKRSIDGRLAGHTCTLVGSKVYMIGGYTTLDGLSEFMYIINIETSQFYAAKFDGLQPVGMYSHVAVYDVATKLIYVHGGMSFDNEEIKPSSGTYTVTVSDYPVWDYVEVHPDDVNVVPRLVGHVAFTQNNSMYVLGGYSDLVSYNMDLYIWKLKCNRWDKVPKTDASWLINTMSGALFSGATTNDNGRFYVFGGYPSSTLIPSLHVFTPTNNITVAENCTNLELRSRKCSTFSSCSSCKSGFGDNVNRCQWCRCRSTSIPRTCVSTNQVCNCELVLDPFDIRKCHKGDCFTSTCKNCLGDCFWTSHFKYNSELQRSYSREDGFPYNCFTETLISLIGDKEERKIIEQKSTAPCPTSCSSYKTCSTCVAARGDFAGSKSCVWSAERMECISFALLPMKCSVSRCGILYTNHTGCPATDVCSSQKNCLACLKNPLCGWCAKGDKGYGSCMDGNILEPRKGECGISPDSGAKTLKLIDPSGSVNYTWAFAMCPLENECMNDHDTCGAFEICKDLPVGYRCLCKEGYERVKSECRPVCKPGCGNGTCVTPGVCICLFGWTGQYCNVSCQCNGHSNCLNETIPHVCTACQNNTKGVSCESCLPMFVGDPRNGGKCKPCFNFCEGNSDICMLKTDRDQIIKDGIGDNRSAILKWAKQNMRKGPQFEADTACLLCSNHSTGVSCHQCIDGYYKDKGDDKNGKSDYRCVTCNCNGHGTLCDPATGLSCQCNHNTMSDKLCRADCEHEQCNKCISNYVGDPKNDRQCYKKINTDIPESISVSGKEPFFFAATPSFTNVNIRINVDVMEGGVEVFITDNDHIFELQLNNSRLVVSPYDAVTKSKRKRRESDGLINTYKFMPSRSALKDRITTFVDYESRVLWIYNVHKRLVINIDHNQHNLRKKWFYLAIKPTNKTGTETKARVYFRQDLPRIDLLLFFLVLSVILLFILSGFVIGMKIRLDFIRHAEQTTHEHEMSAMRSRPLAGYPLLCQLEEETVKKRKNRLHSPTNQNSSRNKVSSGSNTDNNRRKAPRLVLPLAVQETEDKMAAVVSAVVQLPKNELSEWNLTIGSGICQMQNQQLLHVRTNNAQSTGKKVQTRIHATTIHS